MKLRNFAIINMGQSPKGETYNSNGDGMPFLQGIKTFGRLFPCIDTWTNSPIKIAKKDEILMSVRAPVGNMNFADKDVCIGRGLCSINAKNGRNKYLYYMLLSCIEDLKQRSTGTVFDSINRNNLENLEINVHSEENQVKIENILWNIDSKIELNNQINNNLLEIIQGIIKKKFYNGKLELVPLSNFGRIQGGYAFKSKDLLDEKTKNRIVKIKNINTFNVDLENTQYILDNVAINVDKKFRLFNGNVIIAMTGAELGKTGFIYGTNDKYFLNQRVGVVRGNSDVEELYLNQIFLLDSFQKMLNSKGYGSAQPNISTSDIESVEIPGPSLEELNKFYKLVNPMYNKIIENSIENQNLEQLRDTLLPKLMNGEIDLENIEI